MSDQQPVDPELFRVHAGNLDALRSMLAEVRLASRQPGQGPVEFGALFGWMLSCVGDGYTRQQELIAYVEETLSVLVRAFRRVANGEQELKEIIRREEPDVATRDGTPIIDEPEYSLSGFMDTVLIRVHDREWVEPELFVAAPVAEFAAPVDPLHDALRRMGLHCAMACVEPLRRLLDDLTGASEVLACHAALWHTAGDDLLQLSDLLGQCVHQDLPRRDRLDVRSYQALMAYNVDGLIGVAENSYALAVIVRAAGDLILLTRDIVRGVIGELFAGAIVWTLHTGAVATRSVMAERLGVMVVTCWRFHAYITALTRSISTLSRTIDG